MNIPLELIRANFPPQCGNFEQVDNIVQYIKLSDIPQLQTIISKDTYNEIPQLIQTIYNSVRNTLPIARGHNKIGVWAIKDVNICRDANDLILKIEGSNDTDANIGCAMYWINDQLVLKNGNRYPRLMYYCKSMYIEIFFNAITDIIYRLGYIPGVLRTPQQYYIKNFLDAPVPLNRQNSKRFKHAVFTLQQRVNGDILDLLTYQKIINSRFPNINKNSILDYRFVVNYITQITFSLHMLQKMFKFRHNDFWVRNCFIQYKEPGEVEIINPGIGENNPNVDLNSYNYYNFKVGGKDFFIRNTGMMMKISDFGWSRFETSTIIANNKQWIPDSTTAIARGFGWSNTLKNQEYVDYLVQLAGWVVCIFNRNRENPESRRMVEEKWINEWNLNLLTGETDEILFWLRSVVCIVLIFMRVLTGPYWVGEPFSLSRENLSKAAQHIWENNILPNRNRGFTNDTLVTIVATEIGRFPISSRGQGENISQVFARCYDSHEDGNFVRFLQGNSIMIGNTEKLPIQMRIPKPLEFEFSMNTMFDFLHTAFVGDNRQDIISSTLPPDNTVFIYNERKILQQYTSQSIVQRRDFFQLNDQLSLPGPNNLRMEQVGNNILTRIPQATATKSMSIGKGIEVYEFKTNFNPLGLINPENPLQVLRAYSEYDQVKGTPIWIDATGVKNAKQFINVVRIPRNTFQNIVMELYHYVPPANTEAKIIRPKKTLIEILGDISPDSVGVVMSGDYFNYKNYRRNDQGSFEIYKGTDESYCSPPSCDATIGYVRTGKNEPIIEDERPIDFYRNFYGLLCFNTNDDNILEDVKIKTYNEVDAEPSSLSNCSMILSGSPVLLQNSEPFFYPSQLQNYADAHTKSLMDTIKYFIPRTTESEGINATVPSYESPIIIGGQGIHFFSENPRAAVGINVEGDLLLVNVEGRGHRGTGVDIIQLQSLMKSLGCVTAINEDGGGTADIMYKPQGQLPSIVLNTNPEHKFVCSDGIGLTPSTALIFRS